MKIKTGQQENWQKFIDLNNDPYGMGVITFCEQWADLMEEELSKGNKLEDIAHEASIKADTEGITGFMYGCAVEALSHVWEHGEELRVWHNLKTQIKDEGKKANLNGGVLNPAVIKIQ